MSTLFDTDDMTMQEADVAMSKALVSTRPFDSCQRSDPERLSRVFRSQRELKLHLLNTVLLYYHTRPATPSLESGEHQPTDPSIQRLKYATEEDYKQYSAFQHTPVTAKYDLRECAGGVLCNRYERDYFQNGLQDLTRYMRPEVSRAERTHFLTMNHIMSVHRNVLDENGDPCRVTYLKSDDWVLFDASAPNGKWRAPALGWDSKNDLGCAPLEWKRKGSRDYTPHARTELNHLIWSTYSWCCKQTGRASVTEDQLLSWMQAQKSQLKTQWESMRRMLVEQEATYWRNGVYSMELRTSTWVEGWHLKFDVWPKAAVQQSNARPADSGGERAMETNGRLDFPEERPRGRSRRREEFFAPAA